VKRRPGPPAWREHAQATLHDSLARPDWQPASRPAAIALTALFAWVLFQQLFTTEAWVPLLDGANLAIHEAGHPLVGLFSSHLVVYGGTWFQLAFPAAFAWHFRRRGQSAGWVFARAWLGESLMNVGRYVRDARAQLLPLVGGGEHDWTEILGRWGLLRWDLALGGATRLLGAALILWALARLWWHRHEAAHDGGG